MSPNISKEHQEFLKKEKWKKIYIRFTQIFIFLFFFTSWEMAAYWKWIDPFIFSSPSRMVQALLFMGKNGMIFQHLLITCTETIVGFILGTAIGTGIAIVLWWNPFLSEVLDPYLVIFNSLPKTALAPILIVWLGNNPKSIIVTALMTSVIVTIMSVLTGFMEVDPEKLKLIYTFKGTKLQVFQKIVFPSSIPSIVNALKINVGLSFVGVIVGEFLVANAGLGYLIVYGSQIFKLDWVMLSVILLAFLAAGMYHLIRILEKKILRNRE